MWNDAGKESVGMKRFSEDHVWIDVRKDVGRIGITSFAADELGEISFIELPEEGTVITQGETLCVIESVKAATDVVVPASGTVASVNLVLEDKPELLNASPEGEGWICTLSEVDPVELEALMNEEEYEALTSGEGEADEDEAE
jgi:glycine cleavage system H protein